ncbi:MAG: UDP-glucose 4-epimerase [Actinobacteria bacterium QS_5_72_10]|nr:MAG: UDP-glucose 4-epimerase [Actinobacteria bacterium QS_5_72_10]
MHALVTGGAGFIGSHLVDRLLEEGHRVTVVDDLSTGSRANLEAARLSGGDRLAVRVADVAAADLNAMMAGDTPEVVFHLAAQISVRASVADPVADATANVVGTVNLLEAARRQGVAKVVNTTSGGCVYGEPARADLPVTERYPGEPHSPYGVSKLAAEQYLATFDSLHGLAWTSLALGNVFGPRQDPRGEAGVVSIFAGAMVRGDEVVIYGDGHQTRDFVHVADVVEAFMRCATAADGLRVNVATGATTSVNELFARLAALTGYAHPARHGPPRLGELDHIALDCARAEAELNWRPAISLDEGLATVVDWVRGA